MLHKPILIIPGQPDSVFFEIFFKCIKNKKFLSPLLIICSIDDFKSNIKKFKFNRKFEILETKTNIRELSNKSIYIININLKKTKNKQSQIKRNNRYILDCFNLAFKLLKDKVTYKFLNGPINKENFFDKKYLGVTEYLSDKFNRKRVGMLIFNSNLSVCPVTTHLPIKLVSKKITYKLIIEKLVIINQFYEKNLKFKPKIAVTGLNPHCESILKYNEDKKIITPAIKLAKKRGISVSGPYPADTIFLKQNRKKFNVILGMYHDQVLTPLKTLYEYDAINITMGLPFLRVSPDHGPNEEMVNKNLSNPTSLIKALEFLDNN